LLLQLAVQAVAALEVLVALALLAQQALQAKAMQVELALSMWAVAVVVVVLLVLMEPPLHLAATAALARLLPLQGHPLTMLAVVVAVQTMGYLLVAAALAVVVLAAHQMILLDLMELPIQVAVVVAGEEIAPIKMAALAALAL
jgi:hypothetical protein